MKHFIKIEPGAVKSQKPALCQACSRPVDKDKDNFVLEAYWKMKRKADKIPLCSLKCLSKWANS